MLISRPLLILIFILCSFEARANFDFNSNCINAYLNILSLKLNTARTLISTEKKRNPDNSIPYLLDNYVDYFTLLTTENKADFERLKSNRAIRLSRIEGDDKRSPYYLFAQAEINLQCALIRGRFQEYFTSAIEINRAFNLLEENAKKFPSFLPNQKNLGMINVILGSVPDGMRKAMSTFGIRGNTANGVRMLENLVVKLPQSPYSHFYNEAVFYLAYIQTDILNNASVYNRIIANTQEIDSESLLRTYIRSYAGMKMAHNQDAINVLATKPTGTEYQPYPYLDYLMGIAKVHLLDNSASGYLHSYLKNYRGINFVKDTYLNLAWLELLKGNVKGYRSYIAQLKTKGYALHEKDKQALVEANDPMPDINLLKARLLFDGGYYDRALVQIDDKKMNDFKILRDKIEYCYRLGRIYDEISKDEFALKFYQFAIDMGKNERYYFASNAALRMAAVYEKKRDLPKAGQFYNKALNMRGHDYENSIENKAKEGLTRTGN